MSNDRIAPGTVIGGRFEVERLANSGGMGEVFRARDRETDSPVAVKLVRHADEVHLSRFEREARTLAQLEHPGIVRYIAHGADPTVFLAMEWLEGEDLSHRLAKGALSTVDTLVLAKSVADALAAAHARGITHRDIKPSNIFLCGGRIDAAKVLDFGVAQVTQSTRAITGTGQLLGTLGYMAPEQALSGRDVTPAVDVYSLGCVLFECITGTGPFSGEFAQVLSKILIADPPRLRDVRKDAPLALDDLIARMLRRTPSARASLATVASDVATFLSAGDMLASDDGRASGTVPAVTGDERRLVAVIVADKPLDPGRASTEDAAADTLLSQRSDVTNVAGTFGGELVVLSPGATAIALTGGTDLPTRAAKCALALREMLGDARVALAGGRGDPAKRQVVSTIAERARELLAADVDTRQVRIEPVIAGLLDATFVVGGEGAALTLSGERPENGARKLLGKTTPCVGRERELAMMSGLVAECLDEPLSTALVITGNPGVGKSRVRHEIVRALRDREDSPDVWVARGDPIAPGSPFGMLGQLLRRMAGIEEAELPEVRRQKLLARVGRNLPIHDAIRVAEFLGELVRAEFSADERPALRAARQDPAVMTDQLRRAWDDLIAAEIGAGPLAIVLEDLQWGDLPTIRFIDSALRTQRHRPLLVLSVARPEVHEVFPGLFRDRRVHEIRLAELTPSAARRLVLEVLGADTDPDIADALVERSHGNAFYLEELIRSVAEGDSSLPETVLATAQARLSRLEPGARRALRAASVFGARFWLQGVAALVNAEPSEIRATLDALVQREVVMAQPSSRFRGDDEYVFRQILVRDAAYEMLTERDRKRAHVLAAEWLEANGERDALVLAEHFERSGERHRAVVWYLWAAEQALEGNDLASVVLRAERGVQCGATGGVLGELTLLKAEASGWAGQDSHFGLAEAALDLLPAGSAAWARAAAELIVACRSTGDDERLRATAARVAGARIDMMSIGHALARGRMVVELFGAGESELADRLLGSIASALQGADEGDAPTIRAMIDFLRGVAELFAGNPKPFFDQATEIARSFEASGNARWAAIVALHAAMACAAVGDAHAGVTWAERAGDVARRLGLRSCELRSRSWLAFHLAESGHVDAALTTALSAVRDAHGDRVAEGDARVLLAQVAFAANDLESALFEAEGVWHDKAFPAEMRGRAGGLLARLLVLRERPQEAIAAAEETLELLARVRLLDEAAVRKTRDDAVESSRRPPS
ncbi:MAG: protein kinase [Labilithrix sp.]|nr:protein kinase [Labilithrix sp.]